MASVEDLALRVLKKIKVLGATESAAAEDLDVAAEKVRAAHYAFAVELVLNWTLNDIPKEVEEPYVLCAAFHAADDFGVPRDPAWWLQGMRQVQAFAHLPMGADEVIHSRDY